jgi:hypothetical protein
MVWTYAPEGQVAECNWAQVRREGGGYKSRLQVRSRGYHKRLQKKKKEKAARLYGALALQELPDMLGAVFSVNYFVRSEQQCGGCGYT